jgi:AcrR family transcriptional regulator
MPRVVKKADVRKSEILSAAYRLFVRDGYEGTTVSSLLEELGISKGAFYHHFASKDE